MTPIPPYDARIEECVHVSFYIPPLKLSDGTEIVLKEAQGGIWSPIRFVFDLQDGRQVHALYHPVETRWEIVSIQS